MRAPIALSLIVPMLALGVGCRGPSYYADKPPTEIAEMVEVELADLGPGEAGYRAPTITSGRSYQLTGRKSLDSGATTHTLQVDEASSGEDRYQSWARSAAARQLCALKGAGLATGIEGSPVTHAAFSLADQLSSCHPAEDCDMYEESYKEKYKDDDGETKKRRVTRLVRRCEEFWRCRSERTYAIKVDDRALRDARYLPDGMRVALTWSCGGMGENAQSLELPAAYLEGYLLAVDGYPHAQTPLQPKP